MKVGDTVKVVKSVRWDNPVSTPKVWSRKESPEGRYVGKIGTIAHISDLKRPEGSALVEFKDYYGGAYFWFSELEHTSSG